MNDANSNQARRSSGILSCLQSVDHGLQGLYDHIFLLFPRGAVPDRVALVLMQLGKPFSYLWLAAGLSFINLRSATAVVCLVLASEMANWILKNWIRRPRPMPDPAMLRVEIEGQFAFPSAHAQLSVAVWGWLAASAASGTAWLAASALIAAVGWSRLYLRHHYPTDILVGWILGACTAGAGLAIL